MADWGQERLLQQTAARQLPLCFVSDRGRAAVQYVAKCNGHYRGGFVLVSLFLSLPVYCPSIAFGAASGTCRGPDLPSGSVEAVGRHRT